MKFGFTSLRVFTPLLMCYTTLMCYNTGLTAQQADPDPPNDPPDSSASSSSAIVPAPVYTRLDLTQKYLYSFNEMAGPAHWVGFAVHAGLDQFRKSPGAWGNGADSFSVRMANAFGLSFLRQNIAFGVRAFDREDPRYFRKEKGTARERTKYAFTRTFMARNDDGGWMPAYSRLAADYATPFLAQTWRPEKFGIGRGFRGGSVAVGIGFGSNLWQEFWPDLKKKVWKGSRRFPATAQWWKPVWL